MNRAQRLLAEGTMARRASEGRVARRESLTEADAMNTSHAVEDKRPNE